MPSLIQGTIKPRGSKFLVNGDTIPHSVTSQHRDVDRSPSEEHKIPTRDIFRRGNKIEKSGC